MLELNYNIEADEYAKRRAQWTEEQRQQIDAPIEEKYMRVLKRARKQTFAEGDVFVVSPQDGVYFYGRILKIIKRPGTWYDNGNVSFIFKTKTREKSMKDFVLDYSQILLGPFILNPVFWSWGMCETVGNYPITKADKKLDYGFFHWDSLYNKGKFVKEDGTPLNKKPNVFRYYSLVTDHGLQNNVRRELILDPTLLEFK